MLGIPLTFFEWLACHAIKPWTLIWYSKLVGSKGMSHWVKDTKVSEMP